MGLAGCTTASGGPAGTLSRALDQCPSATSSVKLSLNLFIKGKATTAAAATTAEDMAKEILDAQKQATKLQADTNQDRSEQSRRSI
ncbi:hypothetical protein IV498_03175 [Paenarthrobacter sp. Z7-10]|uniref:hypothetical protein n=1 Tax=Paenarthrobacter sp. Z7-10 TaxID=2787635 RepID=UPI0022A8E4DF|nr:hypothetical protein [Paenarthrobacter sp. Z7-10]MCZ2402207.1 hypothetical protein [Paenarthrobacter sp. Z7-10]